MSAEKQLLDRLPPHNREAEQSVVGSMLRDNNCIDTVLQIVHKDDFYADAHQKVFETILQLNDRGGHAVDLVILAEALKQRGWFDDVGSYAYLSELWDAAPTAANAEYYAQIVRDKAMVRNLIRAGNEILGDAYKQTMPADQMVETAERLILEIAQKGIAGQVHTLDQAILDTYDRIDARSNGSETSASGLPTGFPDLDELTAGLHASELVIIAARPSVGKCLAADSEIVLADGSVATIEELYNRRAARLLTLRDDWKIDWAEPSAYVDDGVKPVYRVRTASGREVVATSSHPFRTLEKWRPLAELAVGNCVAVPRVLPVFGRDSMRDCEIKLLAYFIGDGCLCDTTPEFTNTNPRIQDDFIEAANQFGGVSVRRGEQHDRATTFFVKSDRATFNRRRAPFASRLREVIRIKNYTRMRFAEAVGVCVGSVGLWTTGRGMPESPTFRRICDVLQVPDRDLLPSGEATYETSKTNPVKAWLAELGLWGKKSAGKFLPDCVFRLPREQLLLFLNRLYSTDGWASVSEHGGVQIGYCSVSERLARQVQHLLLRFGVLATLRRKLVKYRDTRRVAWQLEITNRESLLAFVKQINIFAKEVATEAVRDAIQRRGRKPFRDVLPPGIWEMLREAKGGESWASFARRAGLGEHANMHVGKRGLSRHRLLRFADLLGNRELANLAASDVAWDRVVSIEPLGNRQVYDLTIPDTHNFVANDICVHNTAFSLSLAQHAVVIEKAPVFFVSLEMSRLELAERMLCSHARVDSHRLRKGTLTAEDMEKLIESGNTLRGAKLFIDDTPAQGMLRISANARRLKRQQGIRLVIIDYLQLIEPDNRRDPRHEQVAQISRRLKFLAKELEIPVIALAQVNRASEDRQDHRPRLSDLRESGCLTGDSLVTMADTGARVPIRELVGKKGVRVWALDELSWTLKPAAVSHAFSTGTKPVFRLETKLGRVIRATGNHPFRSWLGWERLDALTPGQRIALSAQNLALSDADLAGGTPLLEFGESFEAAAVLAPKGQHEEAQGNALGRVAARERISFLFSPEGASSAGHSALSGLKTTQKERDGGRSPSSPGRCPGLLHPAPSGRRTTSPGRCSGLLHPAPSGRRTAVTPLSQMASNSDIFWDEVRSIAPAGVEEVFDLTVPGPSNFVANDIIVHNSIEQDADAVMMMHRPDRYEPGQHEGVIEIIIAKNRQGPVGEITLSYVKQYMRFESHNVGTPFDG